VPRRYADETAHPHVGFYAWLLQACIEVENVEAFNVYYISNLHGGLKARDASMRMAAIGHYLQDETSNNLTIP